MFDEIKRNNQKKLSFDCFTQTLFITSNSKITQTDASLNFKRTKEVFTQTSIKKLVRSSITSYEFKSTVEVKDEDQSMDLVLTSNSTKLQNKNFTYKSNQSINQLFVEGFFCFIYLLLLCK